MTPFPAERHEDCYASYLSSNGVKSLCIVAYNAAVNASGVVRLTPLSTETYRDYSYPGGVPPYEYPVPCKDMNTSGLLLGACAIH
jgi:hypothetical protein